MGKKCQKKVRKEECKMDERNRSMRDEVLSAIRVRFTDLWDVTPCTLMEIHRLFAVVENITSKVGTFMSVYTVSRDGKR
jgi:hypothetical protein